MRVELPGDVAKANDRTGDQLRKQQDVECERRNPALRLRFARVHVHDIRDRVERKKRDAERQRNRTERERTEREDRRDRVDVRDGEVRVFEDRERGQVAGDRERETPPPDVNIAGTANSNAHPPIERD